MSSSQIAKDTGGKPKLDTAPNSKTSDGSSADYYILPSKCKQLQDLISHVDMNAQMGEIFRATFRYGRVSHSDKMRDIKKIIYYANAEKKRLEKLPPIFEYVVDINKTGDRIKVEGHNPDGDIILGDWSDGTFYVKPHSYAATDGGEKLIWTWGRIRYNFLMTDEAITGKKTARVSGVDVHSLLFDNNKRWDCLNGWCLHKTPVAPNTVVLERKGHEPESLICNGCKHNDECVMHHYGKVRTLKACGSYNSKKK